MNPPTLDRNGKAPKVYISADMEGVAGVVGKEQLLQDGFEYERFREFMTAELNAAIEAAREAAVREVSDMLGPIEGAIVKWHRTHTSVQTLMPEAALDLIREKVTAGIQRRQELKPFQIDDPLVLDLRYKNDKAAELLAFLPTVERIDNHTVRSKGSIIELSGFVEMALGYPATFAQ